MNSQELKVIITIAVLAIIGGAILFLTGGDVKPTDDNAKVDSALLVKSDSWQVGKADSKVTVVEFADFQCPACAAAAPVFDQIIAEYKDRVNFVFRHFPIPSIHANANLSSYAGDAAGQQGKFWEMYDKLYQNQTEWADSKNAQEIFRRYASELGLDQVKFNTAISSNDVRLHVIADAADGKSAGVTGTPTFFINSEKIVGVQSYNDFKEKIEAALK